MGIPVANTVALVGDPGTGKTTFLLLFFRQAHLGYDSDSEAWTSRVELARAYERGKPNNQALHAFDALIPSNQSAEQQDGQAAPPLPKTVRVFVSMDNTFESTWTTHGDLFPGNQPMPGNERCFFIDATSMLSGRLQDGMRYPRLEPLRPDNASGWHVEELSLGGWNTDAEEGPAWYWVGNEKNPERPIPLGNCATNGHPFDRLNSDEPKGASSQRVLRLLTPHLSDPLVRVRLIKDLLAELFAHFVDAENAKDRGKPNGTFFTLAIDSLTSLLQEPVGETLNPPRRRGDRLQILNLVRWLEELEVTSLLSVEAHRHSSATLRGRPLYLGGLERYLASGVIQLDYHQYASGDVIRYLQILKMRGTRHDMRPYAYDLDEHGIAWLEPLIADGVKS